MFILPAIGEDINGDADLDDDAELEENEHFDDIDEAEGESGDEMSSVFCFFSLNSFFSLLLDFFRFSVKFFPSFAKLPLARFEISFELLLKFSFNFRF